MNDFEDSPTDPGGAPTDHAPWWGRRPLLWLLLIVVAAHGFMLLMDGEYWDGLVWHDHLREGRWDLVLAACREAGFPAVAYLYWLVGRFPEPLHVHRILVVASMALTAVCTYRILMLTAAIGKTQSFWIASIAAAYPANRVAFELSVLQYSACMALFALAALLALRSERTSGSAHLLQRAASLTLFLASFHMNSLLVFYYGLFLIFAMAERKRESLSVTEGLWRQVRRRADYLALPVAFWLLKEALAPRSGLYSEYNRFTLRPGSVVVSTGSFLWNGVYGPVNESLRLLLAYPVLTLAAALALSFALLERGSRSSVDPSEAARSRCELVAWGGFLLGAAIFPYVAVGVAPGSSGWTVRHAALLGLPVSLMLVGGIQLRFPGPGGSPSGTGRILLGLLLLGFCMLDIHGYVAWQARWVKDRSVVEQLSASPEASRFSVYWIDDQTTVGVREEYRFYEWASLFKRAWRSEGRVGFDRRLSGDQPLRDNSRYFSARYGLAGLDPEGPQALMTIEDGAEAWGDGPLVLAYLRRKILAPDTMGAFLSRVTRVTVAPVPVAQRAAPD